MPARLDEPSVCLRVREDEPRVCTRLCACMRLYAPACARGVSYSVLQIKSNRLRKPIDPYGLDRINLLIAVLYVILWTR